MSEIQTIDPADIICNLKAAVAGLECHHQMQLLKGREERVQKPEQPPMFLMLPIERNNCDEDERSVGSRDKDCHDRANSHSGKSRGNAKENCSNGKVNDKKQRSNGKNQVDGKENCPANRKGKSHLKLRGVKSRELRAGILYTGCGCMHRDGLQDDCPRSSCRGQPECLTKPWPVCPPGKLLQSRFPEVFGAPPNPDAVTF